VSLDFSSYVQQCQTDINLFYSPTRQGSINSLPKVNASIWSETNSLPQKKKSRQNHQNTVRCPLLFERLDVIFLRTSWNKALQLKLFISAIYWISLKQGEMAIFNDLLCGESKGTVCYNETLFMQQRTWNWSNTNTFGRSEVQNNSYEFLRTLSVGHHMDGLISFLKGLFLNNEPLLIYVMKSWTQRKASCKETDLQVNAKYTFMSSHQIAGQHQNLKIAYGFSRNIWYSDIRKWK
jgi:hypothetical protein